MNNFFLVNWMNDFFQCRMGCKTHVQGSLPEGHGKPHGHHHVGDPPVLWIKHCQEVAPHLDTPNKAGVQCNNVIKYVNQNRHGYKVTKM